MLDIVEELTRNIEIQRLIDIISACIVNPALFFMWFTFYSSIFVMIKGRLNTVGFCLTVSSSILSFYLQDLLYLFISDNNYDFNTFILLPLISCCLLLFIKRKYATTSQKICFISLLLVLFTPHVTEIVPNNLSINNKSQYHQAITMSAIGYIESNDANSFITYCTRMNFTCESFEEKIKQKTKSDFKNKREIIKAINESSPIALPNNKDIIYIQRDFGKEITDKELIIWIKNEKYNTIFLLTDNQYLSHSQAKKNFIQWREVLMNNLFAFLIIIGASLHAGLREIVIKVKKNEI